MKLNACSSLNSLQTWVYFIFNLIYDEHSRSKSSVLHVLSDQLHKVVKLRNIKKYNELNHSHLRYSFSYRKKNRDTNPILCCLSHVSPHTISTMYMDIHKLSLLCTWILSYYRKEGYWSLHQPSSENPSEKETNWKYKKFKSLSSNRPEILNKIVTKLSKESYNEFEKTWCKMRERERRPGVEFGA